MKDINYFYDLTNIPVLELDQVFMVSSLWYDSEMRNQIGTFDLLVREMPKNRNFLVFTGLEEMIVGIKKWSYTDQQIKFLLKEKLISYSFAKYLGKFKFTGDLYAMPEGTIFFPGEPVVRVTSSLVDGNLLTAFLMTALSSNTIFSSKFIRPVIAAQGRSLAGVAPMRAHGFETVFKAQRSSLIVGSNHVPSPITRAKLNIEGGDNQTIAYHAYISSFPTELEAMEKAADFAKFDLALMVDTYDFEEGLKNTIKVIKERKKRGLKTKITIDSGDLAKLCRYTRKVLDQAGLPEVAITLASNLDEFKVSKLIRDKVPADTFIVNTEAVTSSDDPKLEVVYKLAQIDIGEKIVYKMKLSHGKRSWPGKKQVFRLEKRGRYFKDIIGLENERLGNPLLKQFIRRGRITYDFSSIDRIKKYVFFQLGKLPKKFLSIDKQYNYPVKYSDKIKKLERRVRLEILEQYR